MSIFKHVNDTTPPPAETAAEPESRADPPLPLNFITPDAQKK